MEPSIEEMAQSVKSLPYKHENLNLIPQNLCKDARSDGTCSESWHRARRERWIPEAHWAASPETGKLQTK